jgi:DNA-binding NtrC family response regulator
MDEPTILIVEDDSHMREALKATLVKVGFPVCTAEDVRAARSMIEQRAFGLVITDLKMPNGSGMEVLREVKAMSRRTPVIVLTAYGTVEGAVEAMKEGATDFIQKPFSFEELHEAVEQSLNPAAALDAEQPLEDVHGILTTDPGMEHLLKTAKAVARSKVPILIQGESGTGKELFARFIHHCSPRREKVLVAINCAAIPENLLESELFGHEKGAFTGANVRKIGKFEQADGGTLLMDEIGEMNLALQAKLLRVLQEWQVDRVGGKEPVPVDVRVIATTNADLAGCVQRGAFREDLYYRLNVIPLTLPPLRERPGDVVPLAEHFVRHFAACHGKDVEGFDGRALESLQAYPWKGNVRELKNVVERAVLLSGGPLIAFDALWLDDRQSRLEPGGGLEGSVKEVERELILQTLNRESWNRTRASRKLGISLRTLRNKLQEYRREGFLPAGEM